MLVPGLALQLGRPHPLTRTGPVLVSASLILGFSAQLLGVSVALVLGVPKLWGWMLACVMPPVFCARRLGSPWGVLRAHGPRVVVGFVIVASIVLGAVGLGRPISLGPDFIGNSIAMRGLEGKIDVNDVNELVNRQAIFIAQSQAIVLPWLDEPSISVREAVYSLPRNADQYAAEFVLSGMRLGVTGWGAALSNPTRAAGVSVFGLLYVAELVALLGALALGYSIFRTRFGVTVSLSATCAFLGGIPSAWGWLQSGGSAFVGSMVAASLLLGLVLGGIEWCLRTSNLVLLAALGVTYPDLWLFPLAVLAAVVLVRWLRPSTTCDSDHGTFRASELLQAGALVLPAAAIQPAFLLRRLEDASVGGWSVGEGSSIVSIFGLDARWGSLASAERPVAVGLLPVAAFLALALVMMIVCWFSHSVRRRAASSLVILFLSGALILSSSNDYLHSKFLSYFAGPILVLAALVAVGEPRRPSHRRTSILVMVGLWNSITSVAFLVAMIGQSEVWMPSQSPKLATEVRDKLWVLEGTSQYSGYEVLAFLAGQGALGVVDKNDHCRPGVSVIPVVIKDKEKLELSRLGIEQLQPLNDVEKALENRCVRVQEDVDS